MNNFVLFTRMIRPIIIGIGFYALPKKHRGPWLKKTFEKSGPTYIKIGQFISNRSDIFGKDISSSLKSLQDNVESLEWSSLKHLVPNQDDLHVETVPLATASIAQVHRASFKGKDIVLKIKKPGIDKQLNEDIKGLRMLMGIFPIRFIDEFEMTLRRELDFANEVQNLIEFGEIYRTSNEIIVPKVYPELCTDNVIVMEYVPSDKTPVKSETLLNLFISQLLFENVIHGDLHSGNIGTRGSKIILYDFGNVIKTSSKYRTFTRDFVYYIQAKDIDNTITTMKKMGMVIKNQQMTEAFIQKFFNYLETLDIESFKFSADEIQDKVPVEIDSITVCILRSFSLLEGYCKDQDPSFSYDDILIQNLEMLYMDLDYIVYRANKDFSSLF